MQITLVAVDRDRGVEALSSALDGSVRPFKRREMISAHLQDSGRRSSRRVGEQESTG